jgi:hypothetical protein
MVIRYIYEVTEAIADKRLVEKKRNERKKKRETHISTVKVRVVYYIHIKRITYRHHHHSNQV